MTIFRDRDDPEPSPRQRLERIVRTQGLPVGLSLAALVEQVGEAERRGRGRLLPPEKILEDAFQIYLKAWEALRRVGPEQRAKVRGCTTDLLVLVIDQALTVQHSIDEIAGRKRALEQRRGQDRALVAHAMTLRGQARLVIAGMDREDLAFQDEVIRAATAAEELGAGARSLELLAELARRKLADASRGMPARARLLGLDDSYVTVLEGLAAELRAAEAEVEALGRRMAEDEELVRREAGLTLYFLLLVVDAFDAGHQIERAIPKLVPVHAHRLVGRRAQLTPAVMRAVPPSSPAAPSSTPEPAGGTDDPTKPRPGR